MGAIEKKFVWQKKMKPLVLALEPRMLFDGAAVVVAATADADPSIDKTTSTSSTSTVTDPAIHNAQTEQTDSSAEVQSIDSAANISSPEQLNDAIDLLPAVKIVFSISAEKFQSTDALAQAKSDTEHLVSDILNRPDLRQTFYVLFNGEELGVSPSTEWSGAFDALVSKLSNDLTNSIRVEIRSAEEMHGAKGAFTAAGADGKPTIYLNHEWLVGSKDAGIGGADAASIMRVMVEEVGHFIDSQINGLNDTKGDEGERFSRYLIDGTDVISLAYLIGDSDADTFTFDGQSISVELASYSFVNAYEMVYDLDNSSYGHATILTSDIAVTERWADKEQNLHYFNTTSLGAGRFSDGTGSLNFSGNDVSGALAVTVNGATYYGWISRPIKSNGIVRGFYFWTDADFTNLAAAQLDGNQDLDSADISGNSGLYGTNDTNPGVLDNRGFVLVVDQSWFTTQIATTGITKNISNLKDGDLNGVANTTTITVANVGSSSDRVDASINYLVQTNITPSVTADTSSSTGAVTAVESGYIYSSGNQVVTGTNGSGNVLTNDSGTNALTVAKIGKSATSQIDVASGTTSANGAVVLGTYGTLTIGANGTYVYVVDNANPTVNAMQVGSSVTDQFTYTVSDGNGGTASATVTITINGTDDAPVAVNNFNTAKEHTSAPDAGYDATGNVLTNDTDVDTSDTKSIVGIEQVGYITAGTVTSNTAESLVRFDGGSGFRDTTVTGRTLYYYDGSVYRAVHGSNAALITAIGGTQISGNIWDIKLSQDIYYYLNASSQQVSLSLKQLNGALVGFEASTSETENVSGMKTATLSLTTAVGTYTIALPAGGLTGTLAVGAKVWYDNDSSSAINYVDSLLTVTAIQYDSTGAPINVSLDGRIPFATGTAIMFVSALSAGQTFNGLYGTLNLASNGIYTYTPYTNMAYLDAGDSVVEVFDYSMQDSQLVRSSAKLYITVYGDGTNSPLAVADTGVAYESGVGRNAISPYATSSDPNLIFSGANATGNVITGGSPDSFGSVGTTGTVTSYTLADGTGLTNAGTALVGSYGSLTIATDGSYTYTVANNNASVNSLTVGQTLTEVFWYTITNSSGLTSKTTLTITINGTNDAPVANADTGTSLTEDLLTSTSGNVLVNDSDVDFADTKNVTAIIAGIATPTLVVSAGSTNSSGGTTVDGTYGRLVIGADGSYTYTLGVTVSQASAVQALSASSHPAEVFTYKSIDSNSATSTTTLSFTVNGANEAPVNMINGESISSTSSSVFTTALNTDIQFTGTKQLSVSDSDGDLSTVTLSVEHGTLSFTGGASVAVSGSTVTITGTQAEINAALAYLNYTPTTSYYGADYLTIASKDQTNLWDSDGLLINIANPTDLTVQTYSGPTVYESDLSSGSSPSGTRESNSTTLIAPTNQSFGAENQSGVTDYGNWTLNASTGVFTYTLKSAPSVVGSSSTDSVKVLSYKSDGSITTNTVTVTIVDDVPVANTDIRTISNISGPVTGNLISGAGSATADTSGADSPLTVVGVASGNTGVNLTNLTGVGSAVSGSYGTITIGSNGSYTYTVDTSNSTVASLTAGSSLTETFTYTIKDADGDYSHTTVTITISAGNSPPVDSNETNTVTEDITLTVAAASGLLANATDAEGDSLSITGYTIAGISGTQAVGSPVLISGVGTITINSDGSYSFAPVANYTGAIPVITYTVSDGNGGTDTSTLTLTMSAVNDPPVDSNETNTVTEDITLTVAAASGLLANATDAEGDSLSITGYTIAGISGTQAVGSPVLISGVGTITINSDGSYSFAPVANYTGAIPVITYTVSDGNGGTDTSTLTLTMSAVNDPPVDSNETNTVTEDITLTVAAASGLLANATDAEGDSLSITGYTIAGISGTQAVGSPVLISGVGTITINSDGSYSFAPVANYTGAIPVITYTVSDGNGGTDTSTLTLTMSAVNDPPVDSNETNTVTEDITLTVAAASGLLANATDAEGDSLSITGYTIAGISGTQAVGSPVLISGVGTITINSDGSYSFAPVANYTGAIPVITYTVSDGNGGTDTSTLTLTMSAVNDPPVDSNETNTVTEDITLTVAAASGLLANATDAEGDSLSITGYTIAGISGTQAVGSPVLISGVGTITINSDGSYSFAPVANYTGAIPVITYTVSDGNGGTDTSTLTLTMSAVNDPPVDSNETNTVTEDITLTVAAASGLLANATDAEGDSLSITGYTIAGISGTQAVGSPVLISGVGTITINSDGSYSFAPVANYTGAIPVITYTVSDGNGGTDTSTLTLTMSAVNDPPVDSNETNTVTEDITLTVAAASGLLANATDAEGDSLSITGYTIAGISGTQAVGSPVLISGVGTITINSDGSYSFAPVANYTGAIPVITYTVSDGNGGTDTSTLTLTMSAVNDPPVDSNETNTVTEDITLTVAAASGLLANATDAEGDSLSITGYTIAGISGTQAVGSPVLISGVGTITINSDGSYSFAPVANYTGAIPVITYTVSDGNGGTDTSTLTLTMSAVNDPPVDSNETNTVTEDITLTVAAASGLLANATDAEGDSLSITGYTIAGISGTQAVGSPVLISGVGTITINSDGSYSFAPVANYTGAIPVITYTVSDGNGGTDTSTLTLTMSAVNDPPVDSNETNTVTEDITLTVAAASGLLANATDAEGDSLSITGYTIAGISGTQAVGSPVLISGVGTITINSDGSYSFAPVANYTGAIPVITYTVSDGNGGTDTSTLTLTMSAVNDPPVAIDDTFWVEKDNTSISLNLLGNDTDPNNDPLTISSIGGVTLTPGTAQTIAVLNGTVNVSASGIITFTPDANYHGLISFNYVITDGNGGTDVGTVNGVVAQTTPPRREDRGQELAVQNETHAKITDLSSNAIIPPSELVDEIKKLVSQANIYVPPVTKQTVTLIRLLKPGIEGQGPVKASEVDQRLNTKLQEHDIATVVSTESGLRNTLTPPDAIPSLNGLVEYKLPSGVFLGGKGRLELVATQKDGTPLPAWAQFDPVTGKLTATVPTDLKAPLEIKVQARDSVGDKAATVFKIKPRTDKVSLDGKKSLTSQIHDAIRLRA